MNSSRMRLVCLCACLALASVRAVAANADASPSSTPAPVKAVPAPPVPSDSGVVLPSTTAAATQAPSNAGGFMSQNFMTGDWNGLRKTLADDGLKFAPTYIGEVFGNPSGGISRGVIYEGQLNLPLDLDLDRMSDGALSGLTFHVNAFEIHGPGLSTYFVGDFSNTSNIAAYNTLRLQELWLQKTFFSNQLSIKVGNIAVDTEFFASSSAALFINGTFGAFDLIANNIPNAPVYPVASPGVRIQYQPTPQFYAMAGVFGMDDNSNPSTNNQNGTRFALTASSGMLIMSEVGFLLNQGANDSGLQGTYRLGSFVHTANYPTFASQANQADGDGDLDGAGSNYGIYGVMDQQIFSRGDQRVSLFVRSGGAPSNTSFVDYYVDGGFNFVGFIPGRTLDVAGIAVARAHVSRDFSDSEVAQGESPFTAETIIEATYQVQMAPWWSIQPDFQYIVTPGGAPGVIPNATVIGLRTTVAF